jgi:AraC-like DNA-binding protein
MISELIAENSHVFASQKKTQKGIAVGQLSEPLLNAFTRLIDLLDESDNIKALGPIIQREIFFRLLTTEQGIRLHQIVTAQSHSYQISRAIDWLRNNFFKPLSVSELAAYSGMSQSAFYTHFRLVTAMTPLQFQKNLRLNEARRLMLTENLDAMTTTFKVGYESPSQFSREYRRFFGESPLKDIKALRETGQPQEAKASSQIIKV